MTIYINITLKFISSINAYDNVIQYGMFLSAFVSFSMTYIKLFKYFKLSDI